MVILHIACITNNLFNGVCIAAPQHALAQGEYEDVAFLNINNELIDSLEGGKVKQFQYTKPFYVCDLPTPFNHPDLVVFHECYRLDYLSISKELRKIKIPYIILPHGELGERAQRKKFLKKKLANIALFNRFINNASAIQCLSEVELKETAFNVKKFVEFNGIKIPRKKKQLFHTNRIRITYIGRLDAYHKGLDLLIEAVANVRQQMNDNNATIDMYGPDLNGRFEYVQSLIEKNKVTDLIRLHHEVSGIKKEKILLDTDIFIQTSRFEGMPLGVLEALSYGIPCLVTEGTNMGKIILRNKAGIVAKNNSEDIADKISLILSKKKELASMGKNGRAISKKRFTWQNIAIRTISKYKEIVWNT